MTITQNMFATGTMNYLKLKLFGAGDCYDMSCCRSSSDQCLHKCTYVKEIYNREAIPLDHSNIKMGTVPVATEYLTLNCMDCSKSWNGKRTIFENIELRIGGERFGTTGRLPKDFIVIKTSECDHSKLSINHDTIEYIEPENYCDESDHPDPTPEPLIWAFCRAECRYCRCKLYAKRSCVEKDNVLIIMSQWEKCKIALK